MTIDLTQLPDAAPDAEPLPPAELTALVLNARRAAREARKLREAEADAE